VANRCNTTGSDFGGSECTESVWRPGSAWARGGAYSALLDPLAGFKRTALRHEREGREGTTGGGKERVLRIITRISPVRGSATEIQGGNYQI